ncbi:hypothetical protein BU16DRAFT_564111 [Lophium mytilinum]|uniref:FAD/NAD(P)-binding domain-containing protein n=1 Tax=Lophium mytilinum TaxID=390894 RepID=A0A6A6QL21_9PEZI|nr:hypothetical protein BU16DRAFT_564111 [Lophium mytilinum]
MITKGELSRYLESLVEDNLKFLPRGIKRVTEKGIEDDTGTFREVDAIICATGFDTQAMGVGARRIYVDLSTEDAESLLVPRSQRNRWSRSTIHMSECACEYMIECIQKLQWENLRWMIPKDAVVRAFIKQVDRYFAKTTFSFTCDQWAKRTPNGRVLGYWPGGAVHQRATLDTPRFEDFEHSSFDEDEDDCLAWMGNGMIVAQEKDTSTTATSTRLMFLLCLGRKKRGRWCRIERVSTFCKVDSIRN